MILPTASDDPLQRPGSGTFDLVRLPYPLEVERPAGFTVLRESALEDRFELLQQWEGTIESITGDTVTASLRDLTDRAQPEEIVDLPLEEFSPNDADLVAPGAVFYWSIGYRVTPTGTKERVSRVRMRRVPPPTRRQLERIAQDAAELASRFGLRGPVANP